MLGSTKATSMQKVVLCSYLPAFIPTYPTTAPNQYGILATYPSSFCFFCCSFQGWTQKLTCHWLKLCKALGYKGLRFQFRDWKQSAQRLYCLQNTWGTVCVQSFTPVCILWSHPEPGKSHRQYREVAVRSRWLGVMLRKAIRKDQGTMVPLSGCSLSRALSTHWAPANLACTSRFSQRILWGSPGQWAVAAPSPLPHRPDVKLFYNYYLKSMFSCCPGNSSNMPHLMASLQLRVAAGELGSRLSARRRGNELCSLPRTSQNIGELGGETFPARFLGRHLIQHTAPDTKPTAHPTPFSFLKHIQVDEANPFQLSALHYLQRQPPWWIL